MLLYFWEVNLYMRLYMIPFLCRNNIRMRKRKRPSFTEWLVHKYIACIAYRNKQTAEFQELMPSYTCDLKTYKALAAYVNSAVKIGQLIKQ